MIRVQGIDRMLDERFGEGPVSSIDFASYDLLHKVLTPARIRLLRTMSGAGPLSIREIARRAGRDFKGVHTDVTSLFKEGLLRKTAAGQMIFPYEHMRFDFELTALPEAIAAAAE